MGDVHVLGGAAVMDTIRVTKEEIFRRIREDPIRYRVGATTRNRLERRIWNYIREYDNRTVYYARTTIRSCLKTWENEALALLADDQRYNIRRNSNIPPNRRGFLYIIDMQ